MNKARVQYTTESDNYEHSSAAYIDEKIRFQEVNPQGLVIGLLNSLFIAMAETPRLVFSLSPTSPGSFA